MAKNSTVKLGNVPFSSNSNTRYKKGKSATFGTTFSGCTYTRLSGNVRVQAMPASISSYNFIEIVEADGFTVRGFIDSIEYINNLTSEIRFKIDGWETWKNGVTFRESYIERYSLGKSVPVTTQTLPEPFTTNNFTCYASTEYNLGDYKYIIATLHNTSSTLKSYADLIGGFSPDPTASIHKIDGLTAAGGTKLSGVYHGCNFIVADSLAHAKSLVSGLISAGYEKSILSVFSAPGALIAANGTTTDNCNFYTYQNVADLIGTKRTSTCTILSDTDIMLLLGTVSAPERTASDLCKYSKIKNSPYTFLRVTAPSGKYVDFDYNDFSSDTPVFGIYGAIGFSSEILLVPVDYQGIQYNFNQAISVPCNQNGMFSSSTFAAWASAQQLKYISTAISTTAAGITAAMSQNYMGLASTLVSAGMSGLNYNQERSIASKTAFSTTGSTNSDFSFCHPESSCFKLMCMSLKPMDAKYLDAYMDNYGYSVSMYDIPDTNKIDDDCYIKTNNVQLSVNCPDNYAAEIRNLFNAGCKFI